MKFKKSTNKMCTGEIYHVKVGKITLKEHQKMPLNGHKYSKEPYLNQDNLV